MDGEYKSSLWQFVEERVVWPFAGWLVACGPALLLLAFAIAPNMLEGLVLLRLDDGHYPFDCIFLTAMSATLSAFGISIVRIYDIYAKIRFGQTELVAIHSPLAKRTSDLLWWHSTSTGWPRSIWCLWLGLSLLYPLGCLVATLYNIAKIPISDFPVSSIIGYSSLGIAAGILVALGWLLFISLVHLSWTRRRRSACGLFPLEDLAAKILDIVCGEVGSIMEPPNQSEWMWLPYIAGFNDPKTKRILPGHLQLIVMMILALTVYYLLFDSSYRLQGWQSSTFPVGFYGLLLIFLFGGTTAFACFVVGRWRIRTSTLLPLGFLVTIFAGLVLKWGHYLSVDGNRYFELAVEPNTSGKIEVPSRLKKTSVQVEKYTDAKTEQGDTPTFIRIAGSSKIESNVTTNPVSDEDKSLVERKTLRNIYDNWRFPPGPGGKSTMVVVTASGGGIQASAWTAKVLANMDEQCPAFTESIGLISGVSGGSVGAMYYMGHRGFRVNPEKYPDAKEDRLKSMLRLSPTARSKIESAASASSLEAIGWGLAFPDMAKHIPLISKLMRQGDDRGLALETQWWSRMANTSNDSVAMRDLRMRDLIQDTNKGYIPPVIFNSTTVETGQRMMIASFDTSAPSTPNFETYTQPIDFFEFYEPLFINPRVINPRVSTAVRLSASFAYATPVAMPILPKSLLADLPANDITSRRGNYHLCDGGYSDNTGLVAAIRVITEMLDDYASTGTKPPFDQIMFVRIEAFPENEIEVENDAAGLKSGIFGPLDAIFNARVSTQAERAELELKLLIRADDTSFDKQSDREQFAVFNVPEFEVMQGKAATIKEMLVKANKEKSDDLSNVIDGLDFVGKRPPSSKASSGTSGQRIPLSESKLLQNVANQVQQSKEDWSKVLLENLPEQKTLIDELFSSADKLATTENSTSVSAAGVESQGKENEFNIAISSTIFRFKPPVVVDAVNNTPSLSKQKTPIVTKPKQDKRIPNPPLSWMLSPYDRYRIDEAWKIQRQRLPIPTDHKTGTASAGPDSQQTSLAPTNRVEIVPLEKLDSVFEFEPSAQK